MFRHGPSLPASPNGTRTPTRGLIELRRVWPTFVLVGLACAAALAGAERASALGQITYGACSSYTGSGGLCTETHSPVFEGPVSVAISPDGRSAYAVADTGNAIGVFDRGAQGGLTYAGCASNDGDSGTCVDVPGTPLTRADSVAISPEGDSVYVSGLGTITVFDRTPGGQVTYAGCVSDDGSAGLCADLPGTPLARPDEIAVSADGGSVYAAGYHGLTILDRAVGGQLEFADCFTNDGSGLGCNDIPGAPFGDLGALAISPDGHSVYVSGGGPDAVIVFDELADGLLKYGGCVSDDGSGGLCADLPGAPLDLPTAISIDPDGSSVYVSSAHADAITVLDRAAGGQLTYAGCVSDTGSAGLCADAPGTPLDTATSVATSPDGATLYVSAIGADAVTVLDRAAGGQLTYAGCVSNTGSAGLCADAPGTPLTDVFDITVSPDGTSVYGTGIGSNAITQLLRKTAPQTTIGSGPAEDASIGDPSATFGFSADQAGAAFECSLDGHVFTACSTPNQIGPLANGRHVFAVRAITGGDPDPTPAIRRFTVSVEPAAETPTGRADTTAPTVMLTGSPKNKVRSAHGKRKVTFAFVSDEPGSTFACELEGRPVRPCTSPQVLRVRPGRHRFTVRATDTAGNTSQRASRSFRVVRAERR